MWTVIALLLVLWLLGMLMSVNFGGLLHGLLIVAAVLTILQLIRSRRPDLEDEEG